MRYALPHLHMVASMFPPTPDKIIKGIQAIMQGAFDFVSTIGKLIV